MPSTEIAALIATWLRRAGYGRDDGVDIAAAAKALGIDQKNLRQYLSATTSPTIDTLKRIARAIDWEVRLSFEPGPVRIVRKSRRVRKPPSPPENPED